MPPKIGKIKHQAVRSNFGMTLDLAMCGATADSNNAIILASRYVNCKKCREKHAETVAKYTGADLKRKWSEQARKGRVGR